MPIETTCPPCSAARGSIVGLLGIGLGIVALVGMGLLILAGERAAKAQRPSAPVIAETIPWNVEVDPDPTWDEPTIWKEPTIPANASIPTGTPPRIVYPTTPSPFVAVNLPSNPREYQVYDLVRWRPLGPTHHLNLEPGMRPVLSPDGQFLACNDAQGWVEIHPVMGGRTTLLLQETGSRQQVGLIDFVGKHRLLLLDHDANIYRDIPGEWDVTGPEAPPGEMGLCQVWDPTNGRQEKELTVPLFGPTTATFSPGGKYLALQQTTPEGHRLHFRHLQTNELAGSLAVTTNSDPGGHAAGLAFSADGKQIALLWHVGQRPDTWGRLLCWDIATGEKRHDHRIGYLLPGMEFLWTRGGTWSLQWLPDGSGWLLFGHLILRRDDGSVRGRLPPEPGTASQIIPRVFLGKNLVTDFSPTPSPRIFVRPMPTR